MIVVSENRENAKRVAKGASAHVRASTNYGLNWTPSTALAASQRRHAFRRGQLQCTLIRQAEAARQWH